MLIPLKPLLEKHSLKINGCIHAGAHHAQEYDAYKECGIEHVFFIEPCGNAYDFLFKKFHNGSYPNVYLANCAVGDKNGLIQMNVSNDNEGQSNSILQPRLHLQQHPEVRFLGLVEEVPIIRIDELMQEVVDKDAKFDMLMIDVQGYEMEVLKGAKNTLKNIELIYTEINIDDTYENCAKVWELDKYLKPFGFKRVETMMASPTLSWGDSAYIKIKS